MGANSTTALPPSNFSSVFRPCDKRGQTSLRRVLVGHFSTSLWAHRPGPPPSRTSCPPARGPIHSDHTKQSAFYTCISLRIPPVLPAIPRLAAKDTAEPRYMAETITIPSPSAFLSSPTQPSTAKPATKKPQRRPPAQPTKATANLTDANGITKRKQSKSRNGMRISSFLVLSWC